MNQRLRTVKQALQSVSIGWWIVLLTLPALLPLARVEFFDSHDGLFHAHRLAALDRAVRAGVLYPRWFPEFGFGYGQPVLNFYGPLSYYWGLPFTLLGIDAALALKLVLVSGLLASALGMYRFARLHLARLPASVAALVYAYLPYHLVDLYVRGAVAEFLAFVWFPLVLWAFHRLIQDAKTRRFSQIALAAALLAALVLTHSLSAFIFAPVLAAYIVGLLLHQRDRSSLGRVIVTLALTGALGLALTAFHWLPILAEAQYVGLGHGVSQGYREHLMPLAELFSLSPTYPYPADPSVPPILPLGLGQIVILVLAPILLFQRGRRWPVFFFLALTVLSAAMLTTASLPIWQLLERWLAFLQYPWRFQALTALATTFLAGALFQAASQRQQAASGRPQTLAACCLLLVLGVWSLWQLPVAPIDPDLSVEAMWQRDQAEGQIGATWTGEYLPIWVAEQRWAISYPMVGHAPRNVTLPAGQVTLVGVGYNRYDLGLDRSQPVELALHQFHFPGWQAVGQIANLPNDSEPQGILGLAAFDLTPAGDSLALHLGLTAAQRWGSLLSLAAALAVGVALVAQYQLSTTRSPLLLAACYLLLAAVLLAHLALPNGYVRAVTQVNANLENTAELLSFRTDHNTYRPGDMVSVTLYWRALRAPQQDYKTFVHLTDVGVTFQPAQHDGDPGGGFTPTTRWLPGELVPDTHPLTLPADLAPGRYRLWAGMYETDPLRNLAVRASDTPTDGSRVVLGDIEVVEP